VIESSCRKIVLAELVAGFVFSFINIYISALSFVLTAVSAIFFRDPPRKIDGEVVSPADGKVDYISNRRLEIFMNIFDCHVNRSPVSGKVVKVVYRTGSFPPAFMRKRSVERAERNEIWIKNDDGLFKVTQIAGFLARRIVCHVKEGDFVEKGQKIGMIRFGSRVILEVPNGFEFVRVKGEKIKAGENVAKKVGRCSASIKN
jgi:phosphatidylserine decarboxylase